MNNTTRFQRMLTALLNLQATGLYTASFIYFGTTGSLHIAIHKGNEPVLPAPSAEWICAASDAEAMTRVYNELDQFISSALGYTPIGRVDFPPIAEHGVNVYQDRNDHA